MKKLLLLFCVTTVHIHLSAQIPTVRQVFNFSVGDTLEYSYNTYDVPTAVGCQSGYIVDVITSVQQNGDTITYTYTSVTSTTNTCMQAPGYSLGNPMCPTSMGAICYGSNPDSTTFQVYNLDSAIFRTTQSTGFGLVCDTPYCTTGAFTNANYNGKTQYADSSYTLSTMIEAYADSLGMVTRNDVVEGQPSDRVLDTLIYYHKAATGETWGRFIQPVSMTWLTGTINSNGASVNATVYLIRQDTIGHLALVDSFVIQYGVNMYQFYVVDSGIYYIKAALNTTDTNYARYLPTYYLDSLKWSGATPIYANSIISHSSMYNIQLIAGVNPGGPGFAGGWVSQGAGLVLGGGNNYSRSAGDPLSHVQINLLTETGTPVAYTYTDINGHYTFSNLAYGSYYLYAEELNKIAVPINFTLSAETPTDSALNISINSHYATAVTQIQTGLAGSVFPNPASASFTFAVSQTPVPGCYLKLFNLTGKEIKNVSINSLRTNISCADIAAGIYCWQLQTGEAVLDRGKLAVK